MTRTLMLGQWFVLAAALACSPKNANPASGNRTLDDGCTTQSLALSSQSAPGSLATVDVNGDGFPDLVIPNGVNISVFLSDGNGGFGAEHIVGNATETAQLAVADLNGDGFPDIVSADGYDFGTIAVQLGNNDGTFQAPTELIAGGGFGPLAVADFNGDGIADIAFSDASDDATGPQLMVFLGTGGGQFGTPLTAIFNPDTSTDHADSPVAMAAGDLNKDGIPDLVIGNTVFLGAGDGTFTPQDYAAGGINSVTLADLDADGLLDIAAGSVATGQGGDSPQVGLDFGNGDGTFTSGPQVVLPTGALEAQLAVGDVNGDGIPDLLSGGSSVEVVLGQGNRAFGDPQPEFSTTPPTLSVGLFPIPGSGPGIAGANQGLVTVLGCP